MKKSIIKKRDFGIWCNILLCQLLMTMTALVASAQIIPDNRRVTWEGNVGVTGDIPSRTAIYQTITASSGDRTSTIQSAINNCPSGQVVLLGPGTFNITSLTMKSGITLRGSGMGSTILRGTSTSVSTLLRFSTTGYSWDLSAAPHYNISEGLTKGSTVINTSTAHNWQAGDLILIDQINNPSGNPPSDGGLEGCSYCGRPFSGSNTRWVGQVNKITAVTSNTATLETPLYISYDINFTPQGTKIGGVVSNAGVEDLTIDNSSSGGSGSQYSYGTIAMEAAANCWLLRTEAIGSYQQMIKLAQAYRNTIRSCVFHEGIPALPTDGVQYGSNRAYGILVSPFGSANLIEDNIIYNLSAGVLLTSGAVQGNVVAYNYITRLHYVTPSFTREAIFTHGSWPVMNLIEGNMVDGVIGSDYYHGPGAWNTVFRNYVPAVAGKTNMVWSLALSKSSWYWNVVGNILGTNGVQNNYEVTTNTPWDTKTIYALTWQGGIDANVKNTLLRHGNWDGYTNGIVWDPAISNHSLPDSLYLSSRPSWYGGGTWPPVDPTTGAVADIPAKVRYDGGTVPPGGGGTTRPSPPQGIEFK